MFLDRLKLGGCVDSTVVSDPLLPTRMNVGVFGKVKDLIVQYHVAIFRCIVT